MRRAAEPAVAGHAVPESGDAAQPSHTVVATLPATGVSRGRGWWWLRRLGRRRYRPLELGVILLAAIGLGVILASWRRFFDLSVYYGAVQYWADGGAIYDFVAPNSTYGFTYTPFAALMMLPMALMPWPVAIVASCLATIVATVLLVSWFVDPIARRHGWVPWYAVGVVLACVMAFDPLRETFLFGQVNMYLVVLVGFDLLFLTRRGSRFAGVGIGLATALKLTPGVFLVYLLVTGRWRAALTATSAAAGATMVGAALAPDESRVFWTDALWNTDRVGQADYISNQSLHGAVARLNPLDPSTVLWILAVVAVLAVWVVRVRRSAAAGDEKAGFALTGVVTCLISPITWVHHLVWVLPALLVLLDRALAVTDRRLDEAERAGVRQRAWLWGLLGVSYFVLGSRVVWAFDDTWTNPLVWFVSNAYVWVSLALLIALPIALAPAAVARPKPVPTPVAVEPVPGPDAVPAVTAATDVVDSAGTRRRDGAMAGVGGRSRD
jgi:alpha-1,2-mannosyltransferase